MLEGCVDWPEELAQEYKEKGYWQDITLGEHFDNWVEKYADREAIACNGETVTYRQLGERVNRLAYQLVSMGVKTYDPVIVQLFNGPEILYLFYACFKIGAIPICSLPTHRWAEIQLFAEMTQAKVHVIPAGVVQDFDYEAFADDLREEIPSLDHVITAGQPQRSNMVSIHDLIEKDADLKQVEQTLADYRPDPFEPALFQLSGGTTGVPKIIPRTHADYYHNAACCAKRYEINQDSRFVAPLPMSHNAPLSFMILPTHMSGGLIVPVAPKKEAFVKEVVENKVNYLAVGGFLVPAIVQMPEQMIKKVFGSIKKVWCATIRPEELAIIRDLLNCESHQLFGMAEGFGTGTRADDILEVKLNTQGSPLSEGDEVKIIDPITEEELTPGEVGEMVCRGPYTTCGYYKAPERNLEAFTKDGFYRSGDLATLDEHRNLTWKGRIKDCIDRGGEKVSAEEVENHIITHPKVQNVAVVGMPDKSLGERICAFVVPVPDANLNLDEVRDYLLNNRRIAKFKAPERLELIDALPVSKLGKFEKKSLRDKIRTIIEAESESR